jgi:hypothetical protein
MGFIELGPTSPSRVAKTAWRVGGYMNAKSNRRFRQTRLRRAEHFLERLP